MALISRENICYSFHIPTSSEVNVISIIMSWEVAGIQCLAQIRVTSRLNTLHWNFSMYYVFYMSHALLSVCQCLVGVAIPCFLCSHDCWGFILFSQDITLQCLKAVPQTEAHMGITPFCTFNYVTLYIIYYYFHIKIFKQYCVVFLVLYCVSVILSTSTPIVSIQRAI